MLGRAWVNGEWSKRSLQREEMKSEERGATGRNEKGGEKEKKRKKRKKKILKSIIKFNYGQNF